MESSSASNWRYTVVHTEFSFVLLIEEQKKKKKYARIGLMPARETERNADSKSKERMDEGS